jgi:hypothetical protein
VISVRAKRSKEGIRYRIVDEHEGDFDFSPELTDQPLSFGELVQLIEGATIVGWEADAVGLPDIYRAYNVEEGDDPEKLRDFVTVSSEFYPRLYDYFEAQAEKWVRSKRK